MNTPTDVVRDSATMLGRNLLHARRYPGLTLSIAGMPIMFLLLFVYVFGETMGSGLSGDLAGTAYIDYVTPAILIMTAAAGSLSTAVGVATDMTEGIIARFRTMAIAHTSILTGHVIGSMITTLISMAAVTAVALAIGFRPSAGIVEWIGALGVLALLIFALTWLAMVIGLFAATPESASNMPMPLIVLPFLGSGFVPTESMPAGLRWFAEYQPFTPVIETVRGLLFGTPIGNSGYLAVAWCLGIALVAYLGAKTLFHRTPKS